MGLFYLDFIIGLFYLDFIIGLTIWASMDHVREGTGPIISGNSQPFPASLSRRRRRRRRLVVLLSRSRHAVPVPLGCSVPGRHPATPRLTSPPQRWIAKSTARPELGRPSLIRCSSHIHQTSKHLAAAKGDSMEIHSRRPATCLHLHLVG